MRDHVLKFPSAEVSFSLADAAGLTQIDKDGKLTLTAYTKEYGIFVQGVISQNFPLDLEMKPIKPPVVLDGWWVRVRIMADKPLPSVFLPFVTSERPEGLWVIA